MRVDELILVVQQFVALVEHVAVGQRVEDRQLLDESALVNREAHFVPLELQRETVLRCNANDAACLHAAFKAVVHLRHVLRGQLHVAVERQAQQPAAHQAGSEVAVQIVVRLVDELREKVQPKKPFGLRQVQHEHRQDDACLALAHVELRDSARVVDAKLRDAVLHAPYLQPLLDLEHEPLRVLLHAPLAAHLFQLSLELLRVGLHRKQRHPLELILEHAQREPLEDRQA